MITEQQLALLRRMAEAARQADMDVGIGANVLLALLNEIDLLRPILEHARNSYDVQNHPAEEGDLYKAIATYDNRPS